MRLGTMCMWLRMKGPRHQLSDVGRGVASGDGRWRLLAGDGSDINEVRGNSALNRGKKAGEVPDAQLGAIRFELCDFQKRRYGRGTGAYIPWKSFQMLPPVFVSAPSYLTRSLKSLESQVESRAGLRASMTRESRARLACCTSAAARLPQMRSSIGAGRSPRVNGCRSRRRPRSAALWLPVSH